MTFVEIALILTYVCVLLIKSCDMSSVGRLQRGAESFAKATCSTYGLGDTASGESVALQLLDALSAVLHHES